MRLLSIFIDRYDSGQALEYSNGFCDRKCRQVSAESSCRMAEPVASDGPPQEDAHSVGNLSPFSGAIMDGSCKWLRLTRVEYAD